MHYFAEPESELQGESHCEISFTANLKSEIRDILQVINFNLFLLSLAGAVFKYPHFTKLSTQASNDRYGMKSV